MEHPQDTPEAPTEGRIAILAKKRETKKEKNKEVVTWSANGRSSPAVHVQLEAGGVEAQQLVGGNTEPRSPVAGRISRTSGT